MKECPLRRAATSLEPGATTPKPRTEKMGLATAQILYPYANSL
jgi:hypothetical protein